MPFALVFIGLLMVVTGAKGTYKEFGTELVQDFTGPGNFTWWIMSVGAVGALGYYSPLRGFSRWFMALIIISMLLAQQRGTSGGFFGQLNKALQSGPTPTAPASDAASATSAPTQPKMATGLDPASITLPSPQASNSKAQENFGKVLSLVKLFAF